MRGAIICIAIEVVALLIGIVLWLFVHAPWWIIPLFFVAPPLLLALGIIGAITSDARSGRNPFQ